jgi:tRNA dimethylallyltransferase
MMLAIYGPTATGKTDLAIKIAKKYNGELISADSRQVYKNLDIGTGKVSFDSKVNKHDKYWIVDGIKINGFDLVDSGKKFTAADFLKFTSKTIKKINKSGKLPIIVGGSGFYINALLKGIPSMGIKANYKLRSKLETLSRGDLYKRLLSLDKKKALSLNQSDKLNPRRLIRAIEIASFSKSHKKTSSYKPLNHYQIIGLTAPNEILYKKVNTWLSKRTQKGLVEEVNNLLEKGVDRIWLENLGLEYKWITKAVTGDIDKDEALKRLEGDIHAYVRRQKTWFKKFSSIKLYDISKQNWKHQLEKELELWYTQINERR